MQAKHLLYSYSPNPRYGPQLLVTTRGERLEQSFRKTMRRYGPSLDWIAGELGNRGVMDLERLATAMWMTRQSPTGTVSDRAEAVIDVKPHISKNDAELAVEEIDRLLTESAATRI